MTKRWLVAVTSMLALASWTVAGCGDGDKPPAFAPPSAAAPSVADRPSGPELDVDETDTSAAFVATVRDALPQIAADRRDEEIALIAEQACTGLSAGLAPDQVVAETRTLGTEDAEATDQATARELIKLAIDKACPDEADRAAQF